MNKKGTVQELSAVLQLEKQFPVLSNESFIDQACSVEMAGYWPCYFCVVMDLDSVLVHELGECEGLPTSRLVSNPYQEIIISCLYILHFVILIGFSSVSATPTNNKPWLSARNGHH